MRAAGTPKRESTASSDDKIECVVPIASAVPGAVTALLKLCPLSPGKVAFAWKTAVGAALERVTAVRLERGVLTIEAQTPHWGREVSRATPIILRRLQALLGVEAVSRLEVHPATQHHASPRHGAPRP